MLFMLDTDICSYIIRERPAQVLSRYNEAMSSQDSHVYVSVITYAELLYGAVLKPSMREIVNDFIRSTIHRNWTYEAARHYAEIKAYLKKTGHSAGMHDMQIAAHARSLGATIVTNNERHFEHAPGLLIENWAKA